MDTILTTKSMYVRGCLTVVADILSLQCRSYSSVSSTESSRLDIDQRSIVNMCDSYGLEVENIDI